MRPRVAQGRQRRTRAREPGDEALRWRCPPREGQRLCPGTMELPANWVGGHRLPALPEGPREESGCSAREGLEAVRVRGYTERPRDRPGAPPRGIGEDGRALGPQLGGGGRSRPETRALPPACRAEGLNAEESVTPSPGRPCPWSDQARGPSLPDSCLWGPVGCPTPSPAARPGDDR